MSSELAFETPGLESDVERLIVFRFDRNPLVCRERIALLRQLNPDVFVCGLYGGQGGLRGACFRFGARFVLGLDDFYSSPRAGDWSWRNGDLALAAWYRDGGHRLPFDVLHVIEWDLLLLAPLDELYGSVPVGSVGLTALTPLAAVEKDWFWLHAENGRAWEELLGFAREHWGYRGDPYTCLAGGPCFPRSFVERYATVDLPELCHDELRLPLFAQILGFPLVDTGLRGPWRGESADPYFNLAGREIELSLIEAESRRSDGRRAFHPVRSRLRGLLTIDS